MNSLRIQFSLTRKLLLFAFFLILLLLGQLAAITSSDGPLRISVAMLTLTAMPVILFQIYRHWQNLSDTLKDANETLTHLRTGHYAHTTPVRARDELGQLAESLNALSFVLRNAEQENLPLSEAAKLYSLAYGSTEKLMATTKSSFLSNMSHEIRTPLTSILGYTELISAEGITRAERDNLVAAIQRNGKILTSLVDDLLDLAKLESDKLEINHTRVPLHEIFEDLKTEYKLLALKKGLNFKFTVHESVPFSITTDALRLKQALGYLIGNAIKFTDVGSIEIEVSFKESLLGKSKLSFVIKDSGNGIAKEQVRILFQPFAHADSSTTRVFGGAGLGLVLSKKLLSLLGGDVVLDESKQHIGSVFVCTIDPGTIERKVAATETSALDGLSNSATLPVRIDGKKVLLVEDSPDLQMLFSHFLHASGATVDTANNGAEGVSKALAGDYHIVLMDLQMPVMDGNKAMQVLRANHYSKPVVALTAHTQLEERRRCFENGFSDHIGKPVNRDNLVKTVWTQTQI